MYQEAEELIAIFTMVVKKVKSKDKGRDHKNEGRRVKEEEPAWEVDETELLEYSEEEDANPNKITLDANNETQ